MDEPNGAGQRAHTHAALCAQLEETPVIAAVKDDSGLRSSLASPCKVVFVLYGSLNTVAQIARTAKEAGKTVFVHLDLIDGLAAREAAVDFIARHTCADGVISTKAPLLRRAKACGLATVQRFFVLDSLALENIRRADTRHVADFVEVLPGLMPKIIRTLTAQLSCPLIAGGLICEKEDVVTALGAGALAVSSTNEAVWQM